MDQDGEHQIEEEIHQLDTDSPTTFLTKDEHDNACLDMGEVPTEET